MFESYESCSTSTCVQTFIFCQGGEALNCHRSCNTSTCARLFNVGQTRRPLQFLRKLQHVNTCSKFQEGAESATKFPAPQHVSECSQITQWGQSALFPPNLQHVNMFSDLQLFHMRQSAQLPQTLQHVSM